MAWARNLALVVIAVMLALGLNILFNGSLDEGLGMDRFLDGLHDPWRTFIGFDLLAGLVLMAGWIVWRQQGERPADTLVWILCLAWWGNIVVAAYALVALRQSGGDPARFFTGHRGGALQSAWNPPGLTRVLLLAGALATALFAASRIAHHGLSSLSGQAYLPGFLPVAAALILLAFPSRTAAPGQ